MWELSIAPWEFVVHGAVVYFALIIFIRLSGKRTIGNFTPLDLLVVVLIDEATQGRCPGGAAAKEFA